MLGVLEMTAALGLVVAAYWLVGSLMVAEVAKTKGYSGILAFLAGLLFLPLAMWYYHAMPNRARD